MGNRSFNSFRENKIHAKITEFTVYIQRAERHAHFFKFLSSDRFYSHARVYDRMHTNFHHWMDSFNYLLCYLSKSNPSHHLRNPQHLDQSTTCIYCPIIHRACQSGHCLSICKQKWPGRHYWLNDAQILSERALIGPYISIAGQRGHKLPNRTKSLPEWTLVVHI